MLFLRCFSYILPGGFILQIAYYNNQLINAVYADNNHQYYCPVCNEKVILKQGKINMPHFAHINHSRCIKQAQNGQTNEHLLGKKQLVQFINHDDVKIESYLQSISQRPDLLWHKLVIEFQCSPITLKRLRQRINGYRSIQMKSLWVLGNNYRKHFGQKSMNKFYYYLTQLGFCMFFWNVRSSNLEMRFNCQYVNGRLCYQIVVFNHLIELLKYLHQSHNLNKYHSSLKLIINENICIRNKLFYKDSLTLKVQKFCYTKHHHIDGAPLICHRTSVVNPLVGPKYLYWKIMILNELVDGIFVNELYDRTVNVLKLTTTNTLIKNDTNFLRMPFNTFLQELVKYNYISINIDNNRINIYHQLYWFNDYYQKLRVLAMK